MLLSRFCPFVHGYLDSIDETEIVLSLVMCDELFSIAEEIRAQSFVFETAINKKSYCDAVMSFKYDLVNGRKEKIVSFKATTADGATGEIIIHDGKTKTDVYYQKAYGIVTLSSPLFESDLEEADLVCYANAKDLYLTQINDADRFVF